MSIIAMSDSLKRVENPLAQTDFCVLTYRGEIKLQPSNLIHDTVKNVLKCVPAEWLRLQQTYPDRYKIDHKYEMILGEQERYRVTLTFHEIEQFWVEGQGFIRDKHTKEVL